MLKTLLFDKKYAIQSRSFTFLYHLRDYITAKLNKDQKVNTQSVNQQIPQENLASGEDALVQPEQQNMLKPG